MGSASIRFSTYHNAPFPFTRRSFTTVLNSSSLLSAKTSSSSQSIQFRVYLQCQGCASGDFSSSPSRKRLIHIRCGEGMSSPPCLLVFFADNSLITSFGSCDMSLVLGRKKQWGDKLTTTAGHHRVPRDWCIH